MYIRPLKSPEDHTNALREIERLWSAPIDSPEGDKLEVLTTLVEAYEARHCPIPPADPVDVLHFAIDEMGRSQADLARVLGSRARASEILNRRRPLTLDMIRAISAEWHLPIDLLAASYSLARQSA